MPAKEKQDKQPKKDNNKDADSKESKKEKTHFLKNFRDRVRGKKKEESPPPQPKNNKDKIENSKKKSQKNTLSSPTGSSQIGKEELFGSLPPLKEVQNPEEKNQLFIKKLKLCSITFDFSLQDQKETQAREIKRKMLTELIDYISQSKAWTSEESLKAILIMISSNLFRSLPPSIYDDDFDPDEDEPIHDPSWPHLQFVYEFLLRFIVSNNTDPKMLKKFIDRRFLLSIIDLFNSEDSRERDYLKTILHRIYGKFMSFRSFLRRAINNVFYRVIYETGKHNGLAELLEILGSIINGFAIPLKDEHQKFLRNVLIPLHKVRSLGQFHPQLAYCVVQFMEKDQTLPPTVIYGLLKFWPETSCSKQLLFLNELEEILEMTPTNLLVKIIDPLFKRIGKCIQNQHFQVAERALFLWNNDHIASFISDNRHEIIPILYPALEFNCNNHWNATVKQLTQHIVQQFQSMDNLLFEKVKKEHEKDKEGEKELTREEKWNLLKQQTQNKTIIG